MPGAVRRLLVATGVAAAAAIPLLASPASAAPAPDPGQQSADARQAANDAAGRYQEIQTRYDVLGDQIAAIEQTIQVGEARRTELRSIAQRRAAAAYKNEGAGLGALFDANNARDGARSTALLDRANKADNQAVADLGVLNADLAAQRDQLAAQRKQQQDALDQLKEQRKVVDAKLANAPVIGPVQVVDGMVCPAPGAAFSSDFGQRRSGGGFHPGNDMLAPTGTPELAVVSGDVTYGDGGGGGMGAYIAGDDGNRYVYYHLSQYVGSPRHVVPGEVIGKMGQTGNATGPHLHFEIHPGGGAPIDPYPTLSRIC
jgi:murein DD-endopeptidase MepM/ murein hydrolase activator NlpD